MGGLCGYRDWANIEIMTLRKVVPTPRSVGGRLGCEGNMHTNGHPTNPAPTPKEVLGLGLELGLCL